MESRQSLRRNVGRRRDEDPAGTVLRVGHEVVDHGHEGLGMKVLPAFALIRHSRTSSATYHLLVFAAFCLFARGNDRGGQCLLFARISRPPPPPPRPVGSIMRQERKR